ncbi:MAG: hypothetical protein LBB50_01895 [Oscillospiraceae bacterium]|nr:hypothetical protein [Oscillospiraceae bacterium]
MVIRLTKATRFFCICAMLLVTVLISIGTRGITVSAPYAVPNSAPVRLVVYRGAGGEGVAALTLRELEADLDFLLESGCVVLAEETLVAALRRETPLPPAPVLLLFESGDKAFAARVQPLLAARGLPWVAYEKSALLTQGLRAAGYAVARLERTAGFALEEQLA